MNKHVFVKPNEQSQACLSSAMARKGRMKSKLFKQICYSTVLGICNALVMFPLVATAQTDTLHLTLDECIAMARRQSVDAAVALGELRSAYWQWRSYRADLLPEVSLSGTVPSYNKRYNSYQQADGGMSFVRNDYLGISGSLFVSQKLWPTGGSLSVESSLDYLHQSNGGSGGQNQLMSLPIAVTLSQPLFAVNHLKWSRRIEPLRYREAQARFLTETEQVAMQAISLYFNLLLAGEQLNIARQNLQTAEKLYEVAQAKRNMGTISQNDVLQMRLDVGRGFGRGFMIGIKRKKVTDNSTVIH